MGLVWVGLVDEFVECAAQYGVGECLRLFKRLFGEEELEEIMGTVECMKRCECTDDPFTGEPAVEGVKPEWNEWCKQHCKCMEVS